MRSLFEYKHESQNCMTSNALRALSHHKARRTNKRGKSGRRVQEVDIQIKTEDVDLFDVDEDGNLSFTLAITQLDDIPERSEVIRLVQEAIEKKKSATALRSQDDE